MERRLALLSVHLLLAGVAGVGIAIVAFYLGTRVLGQSERAWSWIAAVWLVVVYPPTAIAIVLRAGRRHSQRREIDHRWIAGSAGACALLMLLSGMLLLGGRPWIALLPIAASSIFALAALLLMQESASLAASGGTVDPRRHSSRRRLFVDLILGPLTVPASFLAMWAILGVLDLQSPFLVFVLQLSIAFVYPAAAVGLWFRLRREEVDSRDRWRLYGGATLGLLLAMLSVFFLVAGSQGVAAALLFVAVFAELLWVVPPIGRRPR